MLQWEIFSVAGWNSCSARYLFSLVWLDTEFSLRRAFGADQVHCHTNSSLTGSGPWDNMCIRVSSGKFLFRICSSERRPIVTSVSISSTALTTSLLRICVYHVSLPSRWMPTWIFSFVRLRNLEEILFPGCLLDTVVSATGTSRDVTFGFASPHPSRTLFIEVEEVFWTLCGGHPSRYGGLEQVLVRRWNQRIQLSLCTLR